MMPLISVIVPVYNLEACIRRALDGLFAQTHRALQVIAVDDGSSDNSLAILKEYAEKEPRLVVLHQENAGVSAARSTGIQAATGEYIGFCDGDDFIEPTMYERLLANLLSYDAEISHCGMMTEGLDGKKRYFHNTGVLEVHNHEQGLLELLSGRRIEPILGSKLFKRKLFEDIRIDPKIQFNEDLLLNSILFQKAVKTVYEDICSYHYIRREGSACKCAVSEKHVFHPIEVRHRILELCKDEPRDIQQLALRNYLQMNMSAYTLLLEKKGENFKGCKDIFRANLLKNQKFWSVLSFSGRVHAALICYVPWGCRVVFSLYYFLFRKNQYG